MRILTYRLEYLGEVYPKRLTPGADLKFWEEFTYWMNTVGKMVYMKDISAWNKLREKNKFIRNNSPANFQIWNGDEKCCIVNLPRAEVEMLVDFDPRWSVNPKHPPIKSNRRSLYFNFNYWWLSDIDDENAKGFMDREWMSWRNLMQKVDDALSNYERTNSLNVVEMEYESTFDKRSWIRKCIKWQKKLFPGLRFYAVVMLVAVMTPWSAFDSLFQSSLFLWSFFGLSAFWVFRLIRSDFYLSHEIRWW